MGSRIVAGRETPVRRHRLEAGTHEVRFLNGEMKLDLTKTIEIEADTEMSLFVDAKEKSVTPR